MHLHLIALAPLRSGALPSGATRSALGPREDTEQADCPGLLSWDSSCPCNGVPLSIMMVLPPAPSSQQRLGMARRAGPALPLGLRVDGRATVTDTFNL